MHTPRTLLLAAAFLGGCLTTAIFHVPRAHADGASLPRFEHWCVDLDGTPKNSDLERIGAEGWELVSTSFRPPVVSQGSSVGGGATLMCFKRAAVPKAN